MTDFIERDAKEVFEEEFLDFAGYNLQRRALPDARDGCKWGARKLLHSQMLGKLTYDKPFKKAIKSVSQAMSFSYTHGNASAYGTFIRMAKPFAYRIPLQEANGNYGTLINPDDHSADRYVELRGSEIASVLLKDLEKDTITEWEDTYDMEGKFPKVLPAKGFWNGVNGCISIGSGMSSSLPPLNLKETNAAMIRLLWDRNIPFEEICCFPDFPTGASVLNKQEIFESLRTGRGAACKVRATIEFDAVDRCFIVKELPYSVYTNTICKELADIMENDDRGDIKDFCDYTKQKPDLRIYLSKKANPDKVLQKLYKETSLQSYFSINMTVLDKGISPVVMGQKELFLAHIDHEIEVYTRSFQFDLRKIISRLHIIDGLLSAISAIDEVVKTIKASKDTKTANASLCRLLSIDETQAKAILEIKLSRLARLEIDKLELEKTTLEKEKVRIESILSDETLLKKEVENGLRRIAEKFGDGRRTKILDLQIEKDSDDVIEEKMLNLSLTNKNNIFVNETTTLYTQRRGGVGNKFKLEKDEFILSSHNVKNIDTILIFTDTGNFYNCKASEFPINEKLPLEVVVGISSTEKVCAVTSYDKKTNKEYIVFVTKNGLLKKSLLSDYNSKRRGAVKAIDLGKDDKIQSVIFLDDEDIAILTVQGYLLRISTKTIRPIGRIAKGVKSINLTNEDSVISAKTVPSFVQEYLTITKEGFIKRTKAGEVPTLTRYAKGTKIQKTKSDQDKIVDFSPIISETEVIITAENAQIRISLSEVPQLSKSAIGNKSIKLANQSKIVSLAAI